MIPIPPSKPKASRETVIAAAENQWRKQFPTSPLPTKFVLANRAYYRDSMGKVGENDISQYDDAFFIVTQDSFSAWNGNTDPSRYGWSPTADDYMARLAPGVHWMRQRIHRGKYQAFGQDGKDLTIERIKADGTVAKRETGSFGIDLHPGGVNGTSSLGCITVPPDQWPDFNATLKKAVAKEWFALILIDGPIN
jgi:lysozyme